MKTTIVSINKKGTFAEGNGHKDIFIVNTETELPNCRMVRGTLQGEFTESELKNDFGIEGDHLKALVR